MAKSDKQSKKSEMRRYRKMWRRHRKELIKLAKENRDYDYCWLHDFVITKVRHMYEYYSKGDNVWQSEESLNTILSSLKKVLDLEAEIDFLWDNYHSQNDKDASEYKNLLTKEHELYKEIYTTIGEWIQWWWD